MATYRSKETVEAIQWTGDNLDEVKKFAGEILAPAAMCWSKNPATIGRYLFFRGMKCIDMSKEMFLDRYEPAPEQKPPLYHKKVCANCRWYDNPFCHRQPPAVNGWPRVYEDNWCGEFRYTDDIFEEILAKQFTNND